MRDLFNTLYRSYLARFVVATGAYGAVLALSFYLIPAGGTGASLVWPPSALAVAILFFWGLDLWPAIVVACFVVLYARGYTPPLIALTAIGDSLEAVVVVYILRRYVDFSPMLSRLRDTIGLVVASLVGSFLFSSLITLGVYVFNHEPKLNTPLWTALWVGHLVSLISFSPFLLRWLCRPFFTKTSKEIIEGVAVFGSITTLCMLMFWTPYAAVGGISLLYVLIIPLIWAGLRTGPRGITLALMIFAATAAGGTLFGYGPITHNPNLSQALFGIQMVVGVLSLIFLLFTSITEERKEAVVQLQSHVGRLEEALTRISSEDQAKSDFIAILAHELRNPLSPLLSGVELLKTEGKASEETLRMMGAHIHTTARLLDDLLDISRISQKKFRLEKEPVSMKTIIASTLEMVRPNIEARKHTLTTRFPEEDISLSGDPVRLSQIFVNLLNNAAKYTDPGGDIYFEVAREGADMVARVRDNGIGIAPERMANIFEAFGGTETGGYRYGGLRIGLSLARRMAEMHHGTVTAYSEGPGRGSEFTVRIPLPDALPLPAATPRKSRGRFMDPKPEPRESMRILVVDDNEAAARGLSKLLGHHGHTVELAYDAPEALALVEAFRPQVAILDIGLPTMTGYELARTIRARFGGDMALIALTGYGQAADRERAKDAGFVEHLVKPVSISDVQKILLELNKMSYEERTA